MTDRMAELKLIVLFNLSLSPLAGHQGGAGQAGVRLRQAGHSDQ